MKFDLVRPCAKCPFRTDIDGYLRGDRAEEIARSLARGAEFPCHQTTEYVEDAEDGDDMMGTEDSQMCAGAMIAMMRDDQPNQILRVAERLEMWDSQRLDMNAPVGTLDKFIAHHCTEEELEHECCDICDPGCLSPAGYMEGGVAVRSVNTEPTECCRDCGSYTCENCACWCNQEEG